MYTLTQKNYTCKYASKTQKNNICIYMYKYLSKVWFVDTFFDQNVSKLYSLFVYIIIKAFVYSAL